MKPFYAATLVINLLITIFFIVEDSKAFYTIIILMLATGINAWAYEREKE